jgi:hypothetical protein
MDRANRFRRSALCSGSFFGSFGPQQSVPFLFGIDIDDALLFGALSLRFLGGDLAIVHRPNLRTIHRVDSHPAIRSMIPHFGRIEHGETEQLVQVLPVYGQSQSIKVLAPFRAL